MKVLMQGRVDLLKTGGGDKVQIINTASELRKLGVQVDVVAGFDVNLDDYDIVHIFQLDWTPEVYLYAVEAKLKNKPIVLSPIHHNIHEVEKFDTQYVFDYRRVAKLIFRNQFARDTFKNVYRSIFNRKKVYPTIVSIFKGLKKIHTQALEVSNVVLVQTELEAKDLEETYGVNIKWKKVVNGVGEQFLNFDKDDTLKNEFDFEDYIVCVGRIEARKNQLKIIEAVKKIRDDTGLDLKVVFVGRKSKMHHMEYVYRFNKALEKYDWVIYKEETPYESMPAIYKYAKVCVSASWFETTGLTSLEALFCHTNAVASGSRAKEYLGEYVSYCEPDDVGSIADSILKEFRANRPNLPEDCRKEYTWENAAKETLEVYEKLV